MVNFEEVKDVCEKALQSWGINAQEDMMLEESSELITELSKLIKAILKSRRAKTISDYYKIESDIVKEMVDVDLMICQMKVLFLNTEAMKSLYEATLQYKIDRLKEKLSK
jgi:hypothetical protein